MGYIQVQEMLNQILKVRHSFAHGFAVPAYSWTQDGRGKIRLTVNSVDYAEKFFSNLVVRTDLGMREFVRANYGIVLAW